jgi:hypothetical protein
MMAGMHPKAECAACHTQLAGVCSVVLQACWCLKVNGRRHFNCQGVACNAARTAGGSCCQNGQHRSSVLVLKMDPSDVAGAVCDL